MVMRPLMLDLSLDGISLGDIAIGGAPGRSVSQKTPHMGITSSAYRYATGRNDRAGGAAPSRKTPHDEGHLHQDRFIVTGRMTAEPLKDFRWNPERGVARRSGSTGGTAGSPVGLLRDERTIGTGTEQVCLAQGTWKTIGRRDAGFGSRAKRMIGLERREAMRGASDRHGTARRPLRAPQSRRCLMQIKRFCVVILLTGFGVGAAHALDAKLTPSEAFRSGFEAYKAGDAATALEALNYAAENGHPGALWKLGRMYQTGDLVTEDDKKALELFSRVADEYGDGNPHGPDAPFVADAFVTLGTYYEQGIPGQVGADPRRARGFFSYAASYFGDPDAQYSLAMMFLKGIGGEQNYRQAARWFKLAARKGNVSAQAEFGHMLYEGIGVERRPVEGLMWLSIARLSSPGDPSIQARHEQAFSTADEGQRREAMSLAQAWMAKKSGGIQAQATQATQAQADQPQPQK